MIQKSLFTKQKTRKDFENKFMVTKGKSGKDRLGVWDKHIHTTVYKIDK